MRTYSFILLFFILHAGVSYSQEVRKLIDQYQTYTQKRPIEKIYLHLDKPYYVAGEIMYTRAYLTNTDLDTNTVSRIIYVELTDADKRLVNRTLLYSDKKEFAGQILLLDSLPQANYHLRAYTNWMRNTGEDYFFHRDIFIGNDSVKTSVPEKVFDYQVSFFPEGGHLIADTENSVAFKALGNDGYGTNVSCKLIDDNGEELLNFGSSHLGMGRFSFTPQPNRTYQVVTVSNGVEKIITLPQTTNKGQILSVSQTTDSIYLTIKSATLNSEPVSVIGQCRQTVCYALQGVLKTKDERISIPKEKFPTGVAQFTLFRNNQPVSERLIFIDRDDDLNMQIIPDKERYSDREKVKVSILVTDKENKPVQGSFSLSVTDDKVVTPSVDRFNIKGSLLLESDLKGYIENAGWYFVNNEPERREALDILLCTQGWSRFSWEKVKDNQPPVYSAEDEFKITGRLVNALGKPIKDGTVLLLSNVKTDIPETALTDKDGRFGFIGFNNPDTTMLVLQGRNKRNNRTLLDIKLDKPDNKSLLSTVPLTRFSSSEISAESPTIAFIEQAVIQKKYDDNIWTIQLPELQVVDKRLEQKKQDIVWGNMFSKKLGREDLNERMSLRTELSKLGLIINLGMGGYQMVKLGAARTPSIFVVDGMEIQSLNDISYLLEGSTRFIESIGLIDGAGASMWGSRGAGGALIITTRNPEDIAADLGDVKPPGLIVYKPEGYCVRKEFYVPDYNNPDIKQNTTPDLRTTIYWNPVIKTDAEGKAILEFFSADNVRTYSYVLEGMGNNTIGYSIKK
jgi:hypothetical protein